MAIVSKPLSPKHDANYEATFGIQVETDCPTCHRRVKLRVKKEDFDAKKTTEYSCPYCGCTHSF